MSASASYTGAASCSSADVPLARSTTTGSPSQRPLRDTVSLPAVVLVNAAATQSTHDERDSATRPDQQPQATQDRRLKACTVSETCQPNQINNSKQHRTGDVCDKYKHVEADPPYCL